jgi:hypothetical protein
MSRPNVEIESQSELSEREKIIIEKLMSQNSGVLITVSKDYEMKPVSRDEN